MSEDERLSCKECGNYGSCDEEVCYDKCINPNPSETYDACWIIAYNFATPYPVNTERSGKWLIFVDKEKVDEVWKTIRSATRDGILGRCSKVSTMFDNFYKRSVICVYTYDLDDEEDCTRIRQALRSLGITQKIPYKLDCDTAAGKFSANGDRKISKRYE